MYLVDTGASVSVMPKGSNDKIDESFKLRAANGTVIKTYGSAQVKLDLGIKVPMEHEFIKADVSEGVIGADFIIKHGIIINLHAGQLTHGSSGQKIQVKSHAKCSIYAISKLHCERAEKLLEKHKELIYVPGEPLPTPPDVGIQHEIYVDANKPLPSHSARRLAPRLRDLAKKHFDELLEKGVVEPSDSPVTSPLHFVAKKNSTELRWVGDYRALNEVCRKSAYRPPFIADAMNNLSGKRVFSVLDLKNAFEHIMVKEEHRDLTTITTPFGSFRFKRMPYGLCNASATFQKYMDFIMRRLKRQNEDGTETEVHTFVFIDDILVASEDEETHEKDLDAVMTRLQKNNMKISAHKCHFFQEEVEFLGHKLTQQGVLPTDEKSKAIEEYEPPKTLRGIKAFVGLVHFYHKHIKD